MFCVSDCTQESDNSRDVPCGYDADTSNSSLDLSQDDMSQDYHHRGFGEAAARGAKSGNFFPISEETMFLDDPSTLPNISTSSPISMESWVMYSNSSSDECSLSGQYQGICSNDDGSDFELDSPHKNKTSRSCNSLHFEDLELEDEDDEELTSVSQKSLPKRFRAKDTRLCPSSSRSRSPNPIQVDVRMIDFAHTSFLTKSNDSTASSTTVHQGPDGGFLTGLDSLKRLLHEILEEA